MIMKKIALNIPNELNKKIGAQNELRFLINGRNDRIWTCDPYHPKVVRYQAALRPDYLGYFFRLVAHYVLPLTKRDI